MGFSAGDRLGPYEIVSMLGAGGMGEVYRALDTRLERTVAIKVLNGNIAATGEVRQRFEREARSISQLNHPNICTLHDVGQHGSTHFLVMEFLEGETLAQRLTKGLLPLRELLRTAVQVTEALEQAHRSAIVHRDLKPGNVMLTKSGAKLLDFGLAKPIRSMAASCAGGSSSVTAPSFTAAPTLDGPSPLVSPLTAQGTVVGTIQYMSPEQLQGIEADARSDIFAFGAILYEMATGRRPFQGKSQIKVASAILEDEPPAPSTITSAIPPSLEAIIRTCLAKDPEARYACAHDLKLHLQLVSASPASTLAAEGPLGRPLQWAVALAVIVVVAVSGFFGYSHWSTAQPPKTRVRAQIQLAGGGPVTAFSSGSGSVSPDGHYVAYIGRGSVLQQLWLRDLSSSSDEPIPGTDPTAGGIWSPDSRYLAFYSAGKLLKIAIATKVVTTICDADTLARGGSWGSAGVIVLGSLSGPIQSVSAEGGKLRAVTSPENGTADLSPTFLPDGKHFLFSRGGDPRVPGYLLYSGSTDATKEHALDIKVSGQGIYRDGYLLFTTERGLLAQPFDAVAVHANGEPELLVQGSGETLGFSVSSNGILAYRIGAGSADRQTTLYSRTGKAEPLALAPGALNNPRFSPDGTRIAYDASDAALLANRRDLWIYDIKRHANTRVTMGDGLYNDPLWSRDGKRLVYTMSVGRQRQLMMRNVDGSGQPEVLAKADVNLFARSWSPDGRLLFLEFATASIGLPTVIKFMAMDKREPQPISPGGSSFTYRRPTISPDGKWLSYTSSETGREEVFVQAFPGPGEHIRVSLDGGIMPRWRADGRELYFINPDAKVMAVPVRITVKGMEVGMPAPLFSVPRVFYPGGNPIDVTADGKLFVVNSFKNGVTTGTMNLLLNWDVELKKK